MEQIPYLNWAVAQVVKARRVKAGLTQAQLAGLAGLSEDYVSGLERAILTSSLTAIMHIANALQIEAKILVGEIEKAVKNNPEKPIKKVGKPRKH